MVDVAVGGVVGSVGGCVGTGGGGVAVDIGELEIRCGTRVIAYKYIFYWILQSDPTSRSTHVLLANSFGF